MASNISSAVPSVNPNEKCCDYYLPRKKRFCRTEKRVGGRFCYTHDTPVNLSDIQNCTTDKMENISHHSNQEEHPQDTQSPKQGVRVPCPINPNHTVYATRLQHHIKVCPDLRFLPHTVSYYKENLHALRGQVYCSDDTNISERFTHHDLDTDALNSLIDRIRNCYNNVIKPNIIILAEEPQCMVNTHTHEKTRLPSTKHSPQHRALLRCLASAMNGFFTSKEQQQQQQQQEEEKEERNTGGAVAGFLELGAGKGGLSLALQQSLVATAMNRVDKNSLTNNKMDEKEMDNVNDNEGVVLPGEISASPRIVVVDMGSFRRKGDACVRHSSIPLVRLRLNIKDLHLAKALREVCIRKRMRDDKEDVNNDIDVLPPTASGVNVGNSASETSCNNKDQHNNTSTLLERWVALGKHLCGACTDFALSSITSPDLSTEGNVSFIAVVLATCCHHRCELKHLNAFTRESEDHNKSSLLRLPGTEDVISANEFAAMTSMSSWAVSGDFVNNEKRLIGIYCKRVIDALRVEYLKNQGFQSVYLCEYVNRSITEENICIVAFR